MARVPSCLVALAALLGLGAAALAQSVHEIQAGADTVVGTVSDAADVDRVPFRLPAGAVLSISLKAAKGSLLHPDLRIVGTDLEEDVAAMAGLVVAKKLNAVSLKNLVVAESGLRWLEVRGADGTTGGWILTMKVKLPKKAAAAGTTAAGTGEILIAGPGNATATLTVTGAKGSAAVPASPTLLDPTGKPVLVDDLLPTATGFTARGVRMGLIGTWTLRFSTPADGAWTFKASFVLPKPVKRELAEDQVITDPVLGVLAPTSGDTSQTLPATLGVVFGQPGATLTFSKSPTQVAYTGSALVVDDEEAQFTMILSAYAKGVYDLVFTNPDGGTDSIEDAFTVANAAPQPATISPTSGLDTQVVDATVTGGFFLNGVTARLVKGAETITGVVGTSSSTSMLVQFDLRGHSPGLYDLVVQNTDTAAVTLAGAFTVLNAPPTVTALSPGNDINGSAFTATVTGTEMEATPTVLLRKTGSPDIAGTSVQVVSPTQVTASFDTTGAAGGVRDLVFTNPDLQGATLANAFFVSGPVAAAATSLSATGTIDALPAVVTNPTRGEMAVAWVEVNGANSYVYVQRLDASGSPVGSAASVVFNGPGYTKRDVALSWDPDNDRYLVVWSELAVSPAFQQIYGQRLAAADLSAVGNAFVITDHSQVSSWYIDNYHNFRPTVAWNTAGKYWYVYWMQEWSYASDDYDVLGRTVSPGGNLGTAQGVATSSYHEGDPHCAWDPVGNQVILAYVGNTTLNGAMALYVGTGGAGSVTVSVAGSHLWDPRVCVDANLRRAFLSWTQQSGSNKIVCGAMVATTAVTTVIGGAVTIGTGDGDHVAARTAWNPVTKSTFVAWSQATTTPSLQARLRRVDLSGSAPALLGSESEVTGGSGDETAPLAVVAPNSGETAIFWLQTMTFTSSGNYKLAVIPGTYQGKKLWIRRYY